MGPRSPRGRRRRTGAGVPTSADSPPERNNASLYLYYSDGTDERSRPCRSPSSPEHPEASDGALARALAERRLEPRARRPRAPTTSKQVVAELADRTTVVGVAGDVADPATATSSCAGRSSSATSPAREQRQRARARPRSRRSPSTRSTPSSDVYRVNVVAPLALVQRALPALRASGGTIVNVTSDAAVEGYEGWGGYGSSKAALEQLTNVLAAEEPEPAGPPVRSRRHAHPDAPGGVPRRGHLRPARARGAAVPALLRLVEGGPPSGRYRVERPPGRGDAVRPRPSRSSTPGGSGCASTCRPSSRPTSRPRPGACAATACACSSPTGDRLTDTTFAPHRRAPRAGRPRGRQHVGHHPGGGRRHRGRRHPARAAPVLRPRRRAVGGRAPPARRARRTGRWVGSAAPATSSPCAAAPGRRCSAATGGGRLWTARLDVGRPVLDWLAGHGRPIRYGYVPHPWPLDDLPERLRRPAGQRRDAERGPAVHAPR